MIGCKTAKGKVLETSRFSKQIRKKWYGHSYDDSNYLQYPRGDSDFQGIFSVGPPSHTGKMKINGINRTVTFPTLVNFFGTCDLIAGA
jgi:hypothetical protein